MIKVIGKAHTIDSWYRSEIPEYVQRPQIDDIIEINDVCGKDIYRVGGGDGRKEKRLYAIPPTALNDTQSYDIDTQLADELDYWQSVEWMGRE